MQIGVIGVNHMLAHLELRELLARACRDLFQKAFTPLNGHVLLSTCNRTEIYFAAEDLVEAHTAILNALYQRVQAPFDQKLYSFFGHDCFHHLARVTAGLDSAIISETEIQGQVKLAYRKAAERAYLSSALHFLFQKSLKLGKNIRTHLPLIRGIPDLEHAVYERGKRHFCSAPSILLVGAGAVNRKILYFLHQKGARDITLINRSFEPVAQIQQKLAHVQRLEWKELGKWTAFDWIICATAAPQPILHPVDEDLCGKLILDLSVPRNVDTRLYRMATVCNIDDLDSTLVKRRETLRSATLRAESLIRAGVKECVLLYQRKRKRIPFYHEALA